MSPQTKQLLVNIEKMDRTLTSSEKELLRWLQEGRVPVPVKTTALPKENYMTRTQVAEKISVDEVTVWRWKNLEPYYPSPDCPRYHPDEVAKFMSARKGRKHARDRRK